MAKYIEIRVKDTDFTKTDPIKINGFNLASRGDDHPRLYLNDAANIINYINRNGDPGDYDLEYAIDTLIGYFAATGIYGIDVDVYERNTEAVKNMTIEDIEKELGYRINIIESSTSKKKIKTDNRKEI